MKAICEWCLEHSQYIYRIKIWSKFYNKIMCNKCRQNKSRRKTDRDRKIYSKLLCYFYNNIYYDSSNIPNLYV